MTLSALWALFRYYSHTIVPFLFFPLFDTDANGTNTSLSLAFFIRLSLFIAAARTKPSQTEIGIVLFYMTVNSIFNNSKMILWFGCMQYNARWKCQLLNILSSECQGVGIVAKQLKICFICIHCTAYAHIHFRWNITRLQMLVLRDATFDTQNQFIRKPSMRCYSAQLLHHFNSLQI